MRNACIFAVVFVGVSGFVLVGPSSADNHVVTAYGDTWIYRGQRSGEGETSALVIRARVGDTIEFRRSAGTHGVFFYQFPLLSSDPRWRTELGRAVDVERNFEPLPGEPALGFLPSQLINRTGRMTGTISSGSHILTIRIRDHAEPAWILFGCPEHSPPPHGRMFGKILLSPVGHGVHEPGEEHAASLDGTQLMARAQRVAASPVPLRGNWPLGSLSKSPDGSVEFLRGDRLVSSPSPDAKVQGRDVTDGWFARRDGKGPPELADVDPSRHRWYFATSVDLDDDNDLDVLAAVASEADGSCRWWALLSNLADGLRIDRADLRFSAAIRLSEPFPSQSAEHALAVVARDVNGVGSHDLLLYDGNPDGRIESLQFLVRPAVVRESRGSRARLTFQRGSGPVNPSLRPGQRRTPYFVYAYDFDSDGWTDVLVVSRQADDGAVAPGAVVYFNSGEGRFLSRDAVNIPGVDREVRRIGVTTIKLPHEPAAVAVAHGVVQAILFEDAERATIGVYNNWDRRFAPIERMSHEHNP